MDYSKEWWHTNWTGRQCLDVLGKWRSYSGWARKLPDGEVKVFLTYSDF